MSFFAFSAKICRGQEISVSASATLKNASFESPFEFDYRVENLRRYLQKYDSPLAAYAQDFVSYADENGLDYRLVASISGVESTFGKHIPFKSFNAYGWANGKYGFKSWPNSIEIVSVTLRKEYIEKGAPTIKKIARRYAPPSATWGGKVKYFEGKIDTLPLSFDI
ncbi:MAG TPA: hypothetical protein VKC54_00765 [Patescibacteria group bacterium]|nr:hypothetical protein [Patescibacteria group bacterium]